MVTCVDFEEFFFLFLWNVSSNLSNVNEPIIQGASQKFVIQSC